MKQCKNKDIQNSKHVIFYKQQHYFYRLHIRDTWMVQTKNYFANITVFQNVKSHTSNSILIT